MAKKTSRNQKNTQKSLLTPEILEKLRRAPGFPVNLDLRHGKFMIGGHAFSGTKPTSEDEATVTIHGVVENHGYAIGTVRFTPLKWKEFRSMCDNLFKSLKKTRNPKKSKTR